MTSAGLQGMVVLELEPLPFLYFLHVLLAHLVREGMSWFILNIFYVWNVLYPADRNLLETALSMLKSASQDITITLTSHQVWNCSDRFQCLTQISDSLILQNNLGFESWLWCGHQFHFSRGNSSCTQTVYFQSIEFKIKTCRNLCHIFKTKFCQTWHWEQPMIQTPPPLHQKAPFLHSWQKDSSARS